jgi:hypothetical protein
MVERNEAATAALFPPGVDTHPRAVAEEIARILALPAGTRPFRTGVDFTETGVEEVNELARKAQESYVTHLGFGELLHVANTRGLTNVSQTTRAPRCGTSDPLVPHQKPIPQAPQ